MRRKWKYMIKISENLIVLSRNDVAEDLEKLKKKGFTEFVSVAKEWNEEFTTKHFLLTDDEFNEDEKIKEAINYVMARLRAEKKVVVYCGAGQSRSPTVAAIAFCLLNNKNFDDIINILDSQSYIATHGDFFIKATNLFGL